MRVGSCIIYELKQVSRVGPSLSFGRGRRFGVCLVGCGGAVWLVVCFFMFWEGRRNRCHGLVFALFLLLYGFGSLLFIDPFAIWWANFGFATFNLRVIVTDVYFWHRGVSRPRFCWCFNKAIASKRSSVIVRVDLILLPTHWIWVFASNGCSVNGVRWILFCCVAWTSFRFNQQVLPSVLCPVLACTVSRVLFLIR
jgi:hypothetical protein